MLTADTITDEQIRELRSVLPYSNDCDVALGGDNHDGDLISPEGIAMRIRRARARCAEILNARNER